MKIRNLLTLLSVSSLSLVTLISCGSNNDNKNDSSTSLVESSSEESMESYEKTYQKVYMVGDSTMCNYSPLDSYYYPRYGYGTQMPNYFDSEYLEFKNLAMSGRSSYSFLSESNYNTFKNNISTGDYLIIGWGHNDEKYGTKTYRNAKYDNIDLALADNDSFQTSLYKNYIKVAQDAGAYPILATPIVRYDASFSYTGSYVHSTQYGDYRQAIIDVANKYDIPYVDLTTITKDIYKSKESDALYYHAIYSGTDESLGEEANMAAYDGTHINYYGANMISYEFAKALKKTKSTLKHYIKNDITEPTIDILEKYDGYKWSKYESPDLTKYTPTSSYNTDSANTGWYGTTFGNLKTSQGSVTKTSDDNLTFNINTTDTYGKFESKGDGFAFLFKQLPANQNFTLEGNITIVTAPNTKQGGFGIMLRDDCYLNQPDSDASTGKTTNFGAAGYLANDPATTGSMFFDRYNTALSKSETIDCPKAGDVIKAKLIQNGQNLTIEIEYNNTKYTKTYTDYSFNSKDSNYIYCGFFANRGISINVSDIVYTDNGTNQGA